MPLHKGHSSKIVSENIKELIRAGHKPTQAVAISLSKARKYKKMWEGGMASGGEIDSRNEMPAKGYFSDGGQVVDDGGMEDIPHPEMGPGGDNESMSKMASHGPEDGQRDIREINADGNYYPDEVANPARQDESREFAMALRRKGKGHMQEAPDQYAMGGLVQDGPAGDEPVGNKPEEEFDPTDKEDMHMQPAKADGVEYSPINKEPSGMGLGKDAMEALRRKKASRRYGSYNPR